MWNVDSRAVYIFTLVRIRRFLVLARNVHYWLKQHKGALTSLAQRVPLQAWRIRLRQCLMLGHSFILLFRNRFLESLRRLCPDVYGSFEVHRFLSRDERLRERGDRFASAELPWQSSDLELNLLEGTDWNHLLPGLVEKWFPVSSVEVYTGNPRSLLKNVNFYNLTLQ